FGFGITLPFRSIRCPALLWATPFQIQFPEPGGLSTYCALSPFGKVNVTNPVVSKNSDGVNCRPRYAAEWPNSPARTIYFPGNVAAAAAFSVSPPDVLRLGPPTSAGCHRVSAGGEPRTRGSPAWEAPSFYRRRTLPAGSKS